MTLSEYLRAVASGYERSTLESVGHALLKDARGELTPLIPAGLQVKASGGKGVPTLTPWIGIFDPDETESPQEGIYLVYIFTADLTEVVLTLNQGVNALLGKYGDPEARQRLAADARAVRDGLGAAVAGTTSSVSFGIARRLQRAYEAGNIAGVVYQLDAMPSEETLVADLARFIDLYQAAVQVKRDLLQRSPGIISSPSSAQTSTAADPLRRFAPKNDADYLAQLTGVPLVKTRRHETLVRDYGELAASLALSPATNVHPRDLTLCRGETRWLVEAKVVYSGNTTTAVRDAIGQLLQYRHFLYDTADSVRLVALFTEPIGDAYVDLLDSLSIQAIWKSAAGWSGSQSALDDGLVGPAQESASGAGDN